MGDLRKYFLELCKLFCITCTCNYLSDSNFGHEHMWHEALLSFELLHSVKLRVMTNLTFGWVIRNFDDTSMLRARKRLMKDPMFENKVQIIKLRTTWKVFLNPSFLIKNIVISKFGEKGNKPLWLYFYERVSQTNGVC